MGFHTRLLLILGCSSEALLISIFHLKQQPLPCPIPVTLNTMSSFFLLTIAPICHCTSLGPHYLSPSSWSCQSPDFSMKASLSTFKCLCLYFGSRVFFQNSEDRSASSQGRSEVQGLLMPSPTNSSPQPVILGSRSIPTSCIVFGCNDSAVCCFMPFP